jgi:DNA-binding protein H-NS
MGIMRRFFIPIFLLSLIIIVSSCSYSQDAELTNQYNDVVREYNSLLQKHNDLVQQYNSLLEQNNEYREDREQLLGEITKYQNDLTAALEQHQNELTTALEGAIVPPYITMNGRKASYSFRNLNNEIESWSFDVDILEANTIKGTFMRNLDISELNQLGLGIISQRFNSGSKYINLGGRFRVLDFSPYIVKENFQNSAAEFYTRHPDNESRIREVWNMVTQLCPYTGEMKETPRLPLETFLFGGGDCEYLAILTASILKAMSSDWTVQLVYMDSDNPLDPQNMNHVSVFVDTGEYKTFVESTQKGVMSPFQSVDGYYINIP